MVAVYTLTSILSAFLVFFIQPVAAKLALPSLGGIPAVWNGCMLFFQTMLLLGYMYAHGLSKWCKTKHQPYLHMALLLITVSLFPLSFDGAQGIDPAHAPMQWLMALLFYSLALPFFTISASAPLLQKWFAQTDHPNAHNPYFLYAASNIGSMSALLTYPVVIEPLLHLQQQISIWQIGIGALVLCFAVVSFFVLRKSKKTTHTIDDSLKETITWGVRLRWLVLSMVPASLLYGVTAYITTDIASAPLLWLLPLTFYLITFIAVFASRPRGIDLMLKLHLPVVLVLIILTMLKLVNSNVILPLHFFGAIVIIWAIHGLLSRSKPSAHHLTEFFLWMSLGGVMGGAFNTLAAPLLFDSISEYWIAILASVLLRYNSLATIRDDAKRSLRYILPLAVITIIIVVAGNEMDAAAAFDTPPLESQLLKALYASCATLLAYGAYRAFRTNYIALTVCLFLLASTCFTLTNVLGNMDVVLQARSFFGAYEVRNTETMRQFYHGTTLHGIQIHKDPERLIPKAYYSQLGDVFAKIPSQIADEPFALMGLGAGTIACYTRENQTMDAYEIDSLVVDIAADPSYFTYMRDCPGKKNVILGDARLNLKRQPNEKYGIMIMDAFSSDAVPAHLLTTQAMAMYAQKLKPNGIIAFHISNRHLELRYVLAAVTQKLGLHSAYLRSTPKDDPYTFSSLWVVITKDAKLMDTFLVDGWTQLPQTPERMAWTDDFSNLLFTFRFMQGHLGLPPLD